MDKEIDIFFDVDYTVLDFEPAHRRAIALLGEKYGQAFAKEFKNIFDIVLEGKRVKDDVWTAVPGGRHAYEQTVSQLQALTQHQKPFIWSRELHAALAGKRVQRTLSPEQSVEAAEIYWTGIRNYGRPFSDTQALINHLDSQSIGYHLFSSSDFRLKSHSGTWQYDPEYSASRKMERMTELRHFGIKPESITIGDPVDKPEPAFYAKMLRIASEAVKKTIEPQQSIIVGDSYVVDVQVPVQQLHFLRGYWLRRGEKSAQLSENIFSISSLEEIIQHINALSS